MARADLLAEEIGLSWKGLVRSAGRVPVTLTTGVSTNLTTPQETNITNDALVKECPGRPKSKRKN